MTNERHPTAEQMNDYIHGELAPHVDAAVHAHLETCATCLEAHQAEAQLSDMLRAYANSTERDLPLGFAQRIVRVAVAERSERQPWLRSLMAGFRPMVALPAAAAIVLAAIFGFSALHGGAVHATTIEAAYYLENHAALAADMPFQETAFSDWAPSDAR
jgi:anti-sigma factor RsiW